MKSSVGSKNYNDLLGYNTNRSPRHLKNGYSTAGLKSSPRSVLSNIGNGSDKESLSGRSRKARTRKQVGSPKKDVPVYKKRNLDFTDYAYREAVNRLKFLLAESYTPSSKPNSLYHHHHRHHDDSDDTDNISVIERPALSEISKYLPMTSTTSSRYNTMKYNNNPLTNNYSSLYPSKDLLPIKSNSTSSLQVPPPPQPGQLLSDKARPPPEILNFIEKQEGYIEQLERESQFCRDELNNLLGKVKDVISENETLTDQAKNGISRSVFNPDSSESEGVENDFSFSMNLKPQLSTSSKGHLHGPNIVFESRISELEAQLAQASIDFKRLFEENDANKRKIANGQFGSAGGSDAGGYADIYKKQIEALQRDKQTLEDTVRKLQHSVDDFKASDANNFSKTQRNRDMAEQSAFEKAQADIEIKRLKDELERQHVRVREIQHEMAKKIAEERSIAERRYNYQVDQLGGDLTCQWEVASRLQLEVERQKRMESDYRRDLAQKNAQIDELKSELKAKTASLLSDVAQVNAEKQSLEQEITSLRLQLERAERQSKVESSRLNAEIISLRQRLDRADSDLLHSRRENLRLGDQISSLEKELTLGDINRETRPSKEITKMMADMEAKHVSTVSELEGMVQGQKQLMEKLTAECKTLTKKLEDTTVKHKSDKDTLRTANLELMDRLRQIWASYKQLTPKKCHTQSSMSTSSYDDSSSSESKHHASDHNQMNDKQHQSQLNHPLEMSNPTPIDTQHQTMQTLKMTHPTLPINHPIEQFRSKMNSQTPLTTHNQNMENTNLMATNIQKTSIPQRNRNPEAQQMYQETLSMTHMTSHNHLHHLQQQHQQNLTEQNQMKNQNMHHNWTITQDMTQINQKMYQPNHNNCMTPQTMPQKNSQNMMISSTSKNMTHNNSTIHSSNMNHSSTQPRDMKLNSTTNNSMINSSTIQTNNMNNIPQNMMDNNIQMINHTNQQLLQTVTNTHNQTNRSAAATTSHHHQATQNQTKATELWGKNIQEEQNSSSSLQQTKKQNNYCNNSLPRSSTSFNQRQSFPSTSTSMDEQYDVEHIPELSISSPSLFDTSPESSPTLSPAITVHKLY